MSLQTVLSSGRLPTGFMRPSPRSASAVQAKQHVGVTPRMFQRIPQVLVRAPHRSSGTALRPEPAWAPGRATVKRHSLPAPLPSSAAPQEEAVPPVTATTAATMGGSSSSSTTNSSSNVAAEPAAIGSSGGGSSMASSSSDSEGESVQIDLQLPRRSLLVSFTCNLCDGRTERLVNPIAWQRGMVIVQCGHCQKWHKVADAANLVEEIRYADLED